MRGKGYSPVEEIIVLLFISVLIAVLYNRYKFLEKRANITQVKMDLSNINLSVKLFKIRESRYPKNLYELYKKGYLSINNTFIIQNSKITKNGIFDPFGNRYVYDNISKKVKLNPTTLEIIKRFNNEK